MVHIYGKDTCPYTSAARDDYQRRHVAFEYHNVKKDAEALKRMLSHTFGARQVPVIVEDDGRVVVGFGGT
jgi:glutaredoxin 3